MPLDNDPGCITKRLVAEDPKRAIPGETIGEDVTSPSCLINSGGVRTCVVVVVVEKNPRGRIRVVDRGATAEVAEDRRCNISAAAVVGGDDKVVVALIGLSTKDAGNMIP